MHHITIVGGGLAGMAAAYSLLELGCKVTIYESSDRLGGKAGASIVDGYYEDHGYHVFPPWYLNIWQLLNKIKAAENFIKFDGYYQLRAGQFPDFRELQNLTSPVWAIRNLFAGILRPADMILLYYTVLDMLCHPFDQANFLDETSVIGFIQSRFYCNHEVVDELRELILKASSSPGYYFSARTLQTEFNAMLEYPEYLFAITSSSLQEDFIAPFQAALEHNPNFTVKLNQTLQKITPENGRITQLTFTDENGHQYTENIDWLLLTIPFKQLTDLLDVPLFELDPGLFQLKYLDAKPMVALSIYTKEPVANLPKEHVILSQSKYGLSFIDIGKTRPGLEGKSVLNVVSSDYISLIGVPDEVATSALLAEMERYLPGLKDNVERTYLQPHLEQPLFQNDVGSWQFRPVSGRTAIKNLFLAGSYCRNPIDLASMEGAFSSGLLAAESIRQTLNLPDPIPILAPKRANRFLLNLLKYLLMPGVALIKLWVTLTPGLSRKGVQK
jgi:predicted NAD/FAD-dependent oxidoreductase